MRKLTLSRGKWETRRSTAESCGIAAHDDGVDEKHRANADGAPDRLGHYSASPCDKRDRLGIFRRPPLRVRNVWQAECVAAM